MRSRYILAILLLFGFWACSPEPSSSTSNPATASQNNSPVENSVSEPPVPVVPEPITVSEPPILEKLGLKTKPGFTSDRADYLWMFQCVKAARAQDYAALQTFIDAEKGVYFLHRPGVATNIAWMPTAADLKKSDWHYYAAHPTEKAASKFMEQTVFPTEPFKVTPEMMETESMDPIAIGLPPLLIEVKGKFNYFPDQVKALIEYGFMAPDKKEKARLDGVEELVELELLFHWVYYYFGKVNGEWRLIGLDAARCDFSA